MKGMSLIFAVLLLQGCTSSWIGLSNHDKEGHRDGEADAAELIINVPRAIAGADPCKNGHPDDIKKCQAERQKQTEALNDSIRNRTQN
ncbi:hypothetical protein [Shewanella sp. GXUN23E]|uniref:hypothetical protein n=1 Tax=Shewanella sp. GXUN23E TaxID=3422498 RepID=UPI003D7F0F61